MKSTKLLNKWIITTAILIIAVVIFFSINKGRSKPNIVLLTTDGELDFSTHSSLFENKCEGVSASTLAIPAASSIHTGLPPREHSVRVNGVGKINTSECIAKDLCKYDYSCDAYISSLLISGQYGLTNGFETYTTSFIPTNSLTCYSCDTKVLLDEISSKIKSSEKKKFVWVHFSPYTGLKEGDEKKIIEKEKANIKLVEDFYSSLPKDSILIYIPLSNNLKSEIFKGTSIEECDVTFYATKLDDKVATWFKKKNSALGVRNLINSIVNNKVPSSKEIDSENICSWYIFGKAPQRNGWEGDWKLSKVEPTTMSTKVEGLVYDAYGYLGEGLIPPYNGEKVEEYSIDFEKEIKQFILEKDLTNKILKIDNLIKENPKTPLFYKWKGEILEKHNDYAQAFNYYNKASELGINMQDLIRKQAKCHMNIGNLSMAIERFESAYLINSSDILVKKDLVNILFSTGNVLLEKESYSEAEQCFSRVIWLEPKNYLAMYKLACLYEKTSRKIEAKNCLIKLLNINPKFKEARELLSKLQ